MAYDPTKFAKKCAGYMDQCSNARHNILIDEYEHEVSQAHRGGVLPSVPRDTDPLKTTDGLNSFALYRETMAERLRDAAETARAEYREAVGTPTDEALRSVQMLGMREGLTSADIKEAVERFGGQLDCFNAIKGIASRAKVPFFYSHPLEHSAKIIDRLESRTAGYIENTQYGTTSAGLDAAKSELGEIAANRDALGRQMFI